MNIFTLDQIKGVLPEIDLVPGIEKGFRQYSAGRAVVPPVGELLLEKGEVHIKYGYLHGGEYYVIKIASGFYDNPKVGLPSSNGMMLVFIQIPILIGLSFQKKCVPSLMNIYILYN